MNTLKGGTILKSRYQILRLILKSKLKNIYYAQDLHQRGHFWIVNEIPVYIKKPQEKEKFLARFNADLVKFSSYLHQNLTKIIDFFEEDNKFYVLSDHIKGSNLENILKSSKFCLNEKDIAKIGFQLAEALNYLYTRKAPASFYRGIKLKNLILTNDGILKLANLELESFFPLQEGIDPDTQIGGMDYLPPEQFSQKPILDQRSLVFILGAVLYHLSTRKNPSDNLFKLESPGEINANISGELERMIQKATRIEYKKRYSNLGEFKKDLSSLAGIPEEKIKSSINSIIIGILTALGALIVFLAYYFLTR